MRVTILPLLPLLVAGLLSHGTPADPVDLHPRRLSQTRLDVSGPTAVAHIRIFPDDLESAMRRTGAGDGYGLKVGDSDPALLAYIGARLVLSADGISLVPGGVRAEDEGEMWHLTVPFEARAPIRTLVFRNELLVETFPEQRNILRIVHPAAGTDLTWTFSRRREEYRVRFSLPG